MKKIVLFTLCTIAFYLISVAQMKDINYTKEWKIIDTLIVQKSLPKTALQKVKIIYTDAKKRGLDAQVLKALIYIISLQEKVTDEDANATVKLLQNEINSTKNIAQKSVLQIMLANIYTNELRWQSFDRSTTVATIKNDISTWSPDDFNRAINKLYAKALEPVTLLQQIKTDAYAPIIYKGNRSNLRPTLYDLLAHVALQYYKDENNYITKPAYAFTIKDSAALGSAAIFMDARFISKDSSSNLLLSLQLFQQLMRFHARDNDPAAFIDINLERIEWVNEHGIFENKKVLYTKALEDITTSFPNDKFTINAWYLLAKQYADQAKLYTPFGDTSYRYDYLKAIGIAGKQLQQKDADSMGVLNMQHLLFSIKEQQLSTTVESINVPDQPFRMLVKYRNITNINIRIINAAELKTIKMKRWEDGYWEAITAVPAIKTLSQALPATNDYQEHATEIKIDGLGAGSYFILAAGSDRFDTQNDKLVVQSFDVSNISFINNGADYFVLNRETGAPIKDATIQFAIQRYDYTKSAYIIANAGHLATDMHGYFSLRNIDFKNEGNISLVFKQGNDSLVLQNSNYYGSFNNTSSAPPAVNAIELNTTIHIFTDRSIYRPGQTILFKGIGIYKEPNATGARLSDFKDSIMVELKDVNNQLIDSLKVKLNDFGSFTGSFQLPKQVLTGSFSITTNLFNSLASVQVEAYKRPAFYIAIDTLKSSYRLNEIIQLTGFAKAFAGQPLGGATVTYNIKRNTRFLYPWMFWKMAEPGSNEQEIAEGVVTTNDDGRFAIAITALPDVTTDKSNDPVFDFTIDITVTDISGETHETSSVISVGYTSMQLQLQVPDVVDAAIFKAITVRTENIAGQLVPANVIISISPLTVPTQLYRKRLWERPDVFSLDKASFTTYFPYDEYEAESDYHTWTVENPIIIDSLNTGDAQNFIIQPGILKQGWYCIEASTIDKDGNKIKNVQYIQVFTKESNNLPSPQPNWNTVINNTVQPGEKAALMIGTNEKDVFVIQQIKGQASNPNRADNYSFYSLTDSKKKIELLAGEADRNGLGVYYAFVKHNRFYTGGMDVNIPYIDKELTIAYGSFRNKTEPGSKEQWSLTVKGHNEKKVVAELLTTMYDASLDQFIPHKWVTPNIWETYSTRNEFNGRNAFGTKSGEENELPTSIESGYSSYDELVTSGDVLWQYGYDQTRMGYITQAGDKSDVMMPEAMAYNKVGDKKFTPPQIIKDEETKSGAGQAYGTSAATPPNIQARKNFNETAFFLPQLMADADGNYQFGFTMPDALTQWKWMSFAYTKELAFGYAQQTITTQKTLMVQPNLPRFLREGDQIELSAKISNISDSSLTGQAYLQLIDAVTNEAVDGLFQNVFPNQYFTAEAGKSTQVTFPVSIPFTYPNPLTIKIIAQAGNYSDGEENTLPLLSNRILVTESLPLLMHGNGSKTFNFTKLLQNNSASLTNESLTVEYTPDPVWFAIKALPYLMEYPQDCAEQTFNRFYANTLAAYIVARFPRIKSVFAQWKNDTTHQSLQSNLALNPELKQILLEETPWVLDAATETQQQQNIALLFDVLNMSASSAKALQQLQQMQLENGAFPWFSGGYEDRYITQYILTGIGKLKALGAIDNTTDGLLQSIITKGIHYADLAIENDKHFITAKDANNNHLGMLQIQYLYMRSYFANIKANEGITNAQNYYTRQAKLYWNVQNTYLKAMIALALNKTGQQIFTEKNILPSILENAVTDSIKGMYWKNSKAGYYWYQHPIEQQALLIQLVSEMAAQQKNSKLTTDANNMCTWLILNKQTNNWETTKATADACYSLLLDTAKAITNNTMVQISLNNQLVNISNAQAGTGYIKTRISGNAVTAGMGNITVTTSSAKNAVNNKIALPSWGAVYWQYFEDLDKITPAASPLTLSRSLFIQENTSSGKVLQPVTDGQELTVGQKIIIRIELHCDRPMEYLHLKDMRAATMEPVNVLSGYKWQDGLGYYESTKDAATNFFISNINKGTYIFEYPVFITQAGSFTAGIASIECMYAPAFGSHSQGIKINVNKAP